MFTFESLQLSAALIEQLYGLLLQFVCPPLRLLHRLPFNLHLVLHLSEFILQPLIELLHTQKNRTAAGVDSHANQHGCARL